MDQYPELEIRETSTSYFSEHSEDLDPYLFEAGVMRDDVRIPVMEMAFECLERAFVGPHQWTRMWVAGSAVSYQWEAQRSPGDLDVLLGVDYVSFRQLNDRYSGLSDDEISKQINTHFRTELMPHTTNWHGWEVTFYVNPDSWDIRAINPYAAYDLINNGWTVPPSKDAAPDNPYWKDAAARDTARATVIAGHYSKALTDLRGATNPAYRVNAERQLKLALDAASDLFEDIHVGRQSAFSRTGAGYSDWGNYRWQAGKASGAVGAMRLLHDYLADTTRSKDVQTYGMELPDTKTLIRRAAARRIR